MNSIIFVLLKVAATNSEIMDYTNHDFSSTRIQKTFLFTIHTLTYFI